MPEAKKPVDRAKTNRNNRARGRTYENEAAEISGGKRHLANTGGKEDVLHPEYAIQVKSGKRILRQDPIIDGLDAAKTAAVGKNKLGCVIAFNRIAGRPTRSFVIFDAVEYFAWHGYGPTGDGCPSE